MGIQRLISGTVTLVAMWLAFIQVSQAQQPRIYNTVKEKLARGEQVIGGTVTSSDPDVYCAMANSGYDFLWIEMQYGVASKPPH